MQTGATAAPGTRALAALRSRALAALGPRALAAIGAWALAAAALAPLPARAAILEGRTEAGVAWVSGGVSHEELVALRARSSGYGLWVTTAAKKSGAHLADVALTVRDAAGAVVFEQRLPGPWLLIDLPPGRYEIEGRYGGPDGETQRRRTTLGRGARHQVLLYFATGDEVAPENTSPFADNPYGEKRIPARPGREAAR